MPAWICNLPCLDLTLIPLRQIRRYTTFTHFQIKPNPKGSTSVEVQKASEGEKVCPQEADGVTSPHIISHCWDEGSSFALFTILMYFQTPFGGEI